MQWLTPARHQAAVELLADLVRIPSISVSAEALPRAEEAVAAYLVPRLTALGMTLQRHPVAPGRDNLLARWDGPPGHRPLTLEAHMDTVGTAEMSIPPHGAEVRDGALWGRGACDTKGSLAAFLAALEIARAEGWRFDRPVQFVAAMGEESGCQGAYALAAAGVELGWVVVGEPTGCEVVVGHKGCVWLEVTATGYSAHGSTPEAGDNAVYRIGRVLAWMQQHWIPGLRARQDPLLSHPTANVGVIQGGEIVNAVPARCRIEVDHRFLPQDPIEQVVGSFEDALHAALPDDAPKLTVAVRGGPYPGFASSPDGEFASRLRTAVQSAGGVGSATGVSYFTDAGPYHAAGQEALVFGPGDIRLAHGPAEHLPLTELYRATASIVALLAGLRVA
ncbi:MAG: M20 family metallopeptidase [Fimbriimonadaceae bacterium]|nr:M20 family metallopeptidase [Fimbriimonadaceae bacterium]